MILEILFYIFASFLLLTSFGVILTKNPVHSILYLILTFCNATGLLILLHAEFLALVFLIIYVGAIAVLFLFVIMMLNVRLIEIQDRFIRYGPISFIIGGIFISELIYALKMTFFGSSTKTVPYTIWINYFQDLGSLYWLSFVLYIDYFFAFFIASLILLVALLGAITLTLHHELSVKRQDSHYQVTKATEHIYNIK